MASLSSSARDNELDPEYSPGTTLQHQSHGRGHHDSQSTIDSQSTDSPSPKSSPASATDDASPGASKKERGRVRFGSDNAARDTLAVSFEPRSRSRRSSSPPSPKRRPSILRASSSGSVATAKEFSIDPDVDPEKTISAVAAQARAQQIAAKVLDYSPPTSQPPTSLPITPTTSHGGSLRDDVPIRGTESGQKQASESGGGDSALKGEAYDLVRSYMQGSKLSRARNLPIDEEAGRSTREDSLTGISGGLFDGVYDAPRPQKYRSSVLSQLLKLYKPGQSDSNGASHSRKWSSSSVRSLSSSAGGASPSGLESGTMSPVSPRRKWYQQHRNQSQDTLSNLVEASTRLADSDSRGPPKRPLKRRRTSSGLIAFRQKEEVRITVHIAETLSRQSYIIKLCRALMLYGAPTHRLEEYLSMTARVLEIDGQFLYLPGCMLISFDDRSTHTTEVRIVRTTQGIDLGKLKDVHTIYKEVMHDVIGADEGIRRLDELMGSRDKFRAWVRVLVVGLTSATCAPFSFSARLIDLPIAFCFGCLVGLLQLIVAPKSNMYNNVFEVTATIIISFLARAFGSINQGHLFCFSALAQSGIVTLLPGYSVCKSHHSHPTVSLRLIPRTAVCAALELQSRAIVPGSIRIVYAIISSLLLGFGITVGASLYGLFDNDATSATSCSDPLPSCYAFIFVPFFVLFISILYQAKWRQMPIMICIACTGYIVNFFSTMRFMASPQIANTLGALSVGLLANLYSRLRHGVAAATLIPAVFAQVPGGLASTGGLLSGLSVANRLTNSSKMIHGTSTVQFDQEEPLQTVVFNVAASMIQIAIGIAVGLFISALVVYPLGKRRSGLFSF